MNLVYLARGKGGFTGRIEVVLLFFSAAMIQGLPRCLGTHSLYMFRVLGE